MILALNRLRRKSGFRPEPTVLPPAPTLADFSEATLNFALHEWQRDHLCPILERCLHEKGLRILIHGPPQYGKSIIVSERFPAWLLGCDPNHRIGLMCHNETRAAEHGAVVKALTQTDQYRGLFPSSKSLVNRNASGQKFWTRAQRMRMEAQPSFAGLGLSVGLTGTGPDTVIIDDPYASSEDAKSPATNRTIRNIYESTVLPRLGEDQNLIVMFHRYDEEDFAGYLLATGDFEYIRVPAEADDNADGSDPTGRKPGELLSPRRSREWVEKRKEDDPRTWFGQFQGKPKSSEDAFFKRDWFPEPEACPKLLRYVRYWDLAVSTKETGDWTVGVLAGIDANQDFWIKDVIRFRAEWPDAKLRIVEVTEADMKEYEKYEVGVDARLSQQGFYQELLRQAVFTVNDRKRAIRLWADKSNRDKKERASGWAARARVGKVRLARNPQWNDAYMKEILAFTGDNLGHDDQVDATSGAYEMLWDRPGRQDNGKKLSPEEFERRFLKANRIR